MTDTRNKATASAWSSGFSSSFMGFSFVALVISSADGSCTCRLGPSRDPGGWGVLHPAGVGRSPHRRCVAPTKIRVSSVSPGGPRPAKIEVTRRATSRRVQSAETRMLGHISPRPAEPAHRRSEFHRGCAVAPTKASGLTRRRTSACDAPPAQRATATAIAGAMKKNREIMPAGPTEITAPQAWQR